MTNEEAIKILNPDIKKDVIVYDDGMDLIKKVNEACRLAVKALKKESKEYVFLEEVSFDELVDELSKRANECIFNGLNQWLETGMIEKRGGR